MGMENLCQCSTWTRFAQRTQENTGGKRRDWTDADQDQLLQLSDELDQEITLQSLSEMLPIVIVRYSDHPTRPAEACLDRCEQMRTREASGGAGGQWPPATSRPGDI